MTTVADLLNVARSQLGIQEVPPGSNKIRYAEWAGINGQPWCAAFVCWCMSQAGVLDIPKFVYTPTGVSLYRNAKRFGKFPKLGSVVFFQWPNMGRVAHVGFVEAVRSDGSIITIEGNTDARGGRTGGKVMRQVRRTNIAGYGYPVYDAIHEGMVVKPDFDPPLPGIVSWLNCSTGGGWGLGLDGGIMSLGGAPYRGSMMEEWDRQDFVGRVAAHLKEGGGEHPYIIIATSGEEYIPRWPRPKG